MPTAALSQVDHRGGEAFFFTARALRADEEAYRLPRFSAPSRFTSHLVNSDNIDNEITLGATVGYQVTDVTGFVTFRQRRNIDRAPAFGFHRPCAS